MALFFKLWHYLEVQVFLGVQGHPWILVFPVAPGYLVNPSLLGIHGVLKEQKKYLAFISLKLPIVYLIIRLKI